MKASNSESSSQLPIQKLSHAGDCLYRSDVTQIYYAIFKRDGKQIIVSTELRAATTDVAGEEIEWCWQDNIHRFGGGV